MKRYAMKRDLSEPEIVTELETAGATVFRLDKPVDLLVGYGGANYLVECKTDVKAGGKGKRTEAQARFIETWRGQVAILWNAQDAFDFMADLSSGRRAA